VNKVKRKASGTVLGILLGTMGLAWLMKKEPAAEETAKPKPEPRSKKKQPAAEAAPLKAVQGGKS
jgi:hypothetical protein